MKTIFYFLMVLICGTGCFIWAQVPVPNPGTVNFPVVQNFEANRFVETPSGDMLIGGKFHTQDQGYFYGVRSYSSDLSTLIEEKIVPIPSQGTQANTGFGTAFSSFVGNSVDNFLANSSIVSGNVRYFALHKFDVGEIPTWTKEFSGIHVEPKVLGDDGASWALLEKDVFDVSFLNSGWNIDMSSNYLFYVKFSNETGALIDYLSMDILSTEVQVLSNGNHLVFGQLMTENPPYYTKVVVINPTTMEIVNTLSVPESEGEITAITEMEDGNLLAVYEFYENDPTIQSTTKIQILDTNLNLVNEFIRNKVYDDDHVVRADKIVCEGGNVYTFPGALGRVWLDPVDLSFRQYIFAGISIVGGTNFSFNSSNTHSYIVNDGDNGFRVYYQYNQPFTLRLRHLNGTFTDIPMSLGSSGMPALSMIQVSNQSWEDYLPMAVAGSPNIITAHNGIDINGNEDPFSAVLQFQEGYNFAANIDLPEWVEHPEWGDDVWIPENYTPVPGNLVQAPQNYFASPSLHYYLDDDGNYYFDINSRTFSNDAVSHYSRVRKRVYLTTENVMSTNDIQTPEIRVYPNPLKEVLYFSEEVQKATVTDLTGKVFSAQSNSSQIDMSVFQNGVYLITIEQENGARETKKVIKQ